MCERLTYLKLKYGNKTFSIEILEELPVELVLNAYRRYSRENLSSQYNSKLTNDSIISILSDAAERYQMTLNSTFSEVFSIALSEEIKKYYEQ